MTPQVKTYRTARGARDFRLRLLARFPYKLFRISREVGLDFRDRWYVETLMENVPRQGDVSWVGCGPLSRYVAEHAPKEPENKECL